jgi:hypothetical protein
VSDYPGAFGCGHRVGRSHVGDDPDPIGMAERENGAKPLRQKRVVTAGRIPELSLLGQSDGAFSEALEDQILKLTFLGEFNGRLDPIAGIACTGADPDLSHGYLRLSHALQAGAADHTIEMIGSQ